MSTAEEQTNLSTESSTLSVKQDSSPLTEPSDTHTNPINEEAGLNENVQDLAFQKDSEQTRAASKERLEAGKREKDQGNEFFKNGEVQKALRLYYNALLNLNGLQTNKSFAIFRKDHDKEPEKDPLQEEISMTLAIVYSNMAACHVKLNKPERAIECANKALKYDPENKKALFRRIQAYISEGNVDGAKVDLKKLSDKDPDDPALKREWQRLRIKEKEQEKKQRKDLRGMFDRLRQQEEKEEAEKAKTLPSNNAPPAEEEPKIVELGPDE